MQAFVLKVIDEAQPDSQRPSSVASEVNGEEDDDFEFQDPLAEVAERVQASRAAANSINAVDENDE